jgi:SMI1-KNR4 cell-wall
MRNQTWQALDNLFSKSPRLKAEGVERAEVIDAEREVGVKLAEDYKEFIRRYGGAMVKAFPIYGVRRATSMGNDETLVEVTKDFRQQHWPGVENWAVISTDHSGNPIGLDAEGKIWISDHDARAIQLLASSFEEYLREWCLKLPD